MSINTVIFDLDGTLLDTIEDIANSVNYVMLECGLYFKSTQEIQASVGNGVSMLMERLVPNGKENPCFEKSVELFKSHYSTHMCKDTKPYDGIEDVLKDLKLRGLKIAVVSNKFDGAVKGLCEKYFEGLIDVAVGQQDEIREKPAPDMVFEVMNKLGVEPENCIYIGDSEVDIQTANNAGIPCLSVVWGYKDIDFLYENGAQTIIYAPSDILELL